MNLKKLFLAGSAILTIPNAFAAIEAKKTITADKLYLKNQDGYGRIYYSDGADRTIIVNGNTADDNSGTAFNKTTFYRIFTSNDSFLNNIDITATNHTLEYIVNNASTTVTSDGGIFGQIGNKDKPLSNLNLKFGAGDFTLKSTDTYVSNINFEEDNQHLILDDSVFNGGEKLGVTETTIVNFNNKTSTLTIDGTSSFIKTSYAHLKPKNGDDATIKLKDYAGLYLEDKQDIKIEISDNAYAFIYNDFSNDIVYGANTHIFIANNLEDNINGDDAKPTTFYLNGSKDITNSLELGNSDKIVLLPEMDINDRDEFNYSRLPNIAESNAIINFKDSVKGNAYLAQNTEASFDVTTTTEAKLYGARVFYDFADDDFEVDLNDDLNGTVNLNNSSAAAATYTGNIGVANRGIENLNFVGENITVDKKIYAKNINLSQNVTLNNGFGKPDGHDVTANLNKNTLTLNGDTTLPENTTIKITADENNPADSGLLKSDGKITFGANTTIEIEGAMKDKGTDEYVAIEASSFADTSNLTLKSDSIISTVKFTVGAEKITYKQEFVDTSKLISESYQEQGLELDAGDKEIITWISDMTNNAQYHDTAIIDALEKVTTKKQLVEFVESFQDNPMVAHAAAEVTENPIPTIDPTVDFADPAVQLASAQVENRLNSVVAAGDCHTEYGLWARALGSHAKQKMRKKNNGYNMEAYGMTLGLDAKLSDIHIVGGSVSFIDSKLKHKNAKNGDKTLGKSYQASLYAAQHFYNDVVTSEYVNFGNTHVHNKAKRVLIDTYTAHAKYEVMNAGLGAKVGKIYHLGYGVNLTPELGLDFAKFISKKHTEKGAAFMNKTISNNERDKIRGTVGLRAQKAFHLAGHASSLELHAKYARDFSDANDSITSKLTGTPTLTTKAAKQAKNSYNLGGSLTVKANEKYNLSLNYDLTLKSKYHRHDGSVKLKVSL